MPKLDQFYSNMEEHLIMTTSLEEIFVVEYVYKSCVVRIKHKDTLPNLVLLLTLDFDIILGMVWWASCFAKVDYYRKLVKFKFLREPSFMIYEHGSLVLAEVVSNIIAKPMPMQEGQGYLTMTRNTSMDNESVDCVPIMVCIQTYF